MSLPIFIVESFPIEGKAFSGNPAGVCLLEYDDDITDEQKQNIAKELNQGATAFVSFGWSHGNKLNISGYTEQRTIRWFAPLQEVPLCGHGTIAAVKIICDAQLDGPKNINFHSKFRGELGASVNEDGLITLDFPSNPTHPLNEDPKEHPWLAALLQNTVGSSEIVHSIHYCPSTKILLIRIKDELKKEGVLAIKPNFPAILGINTGGFVQDIIVTVIGHGGCGKPCPYFYSRFFAPRIGVNEDHATGLAHTVLTPYWAKELGKEGKALNVKQLSARGADLVVTLVGDRVKIGGKAKIVMKGEFFI